MGTQIVSRQLYSWWGGQQDFLMHVWPGFSKICLHSWDTFVLATNMHGMWLRRPWC